ncbi:methyltransferase [Gallaecimonas kandeliae]|uniref:methyltransferase family protein n=1 Tax=Gallaecimonas kandeliae TaxID=3029055 RepID=UPI00264899B3|nr:methyltransferase [Gallaecimonas kandeliae]WKE64577.1 methyltransferase [Gallaecimonas kandeliae]
MTRYPLLLMLTLLGLSLLLWLLLPLSFGLGLGLMLVGGALFAVGTLLLLLSAGLFRRRATTLDPTRAPDLLVTSGLYRFSRNPMYLGMLLMLLGLALALDSLLGLLFPIAFFALMNWRQIPAEESRIEAAFGDQYRHYQKRTRRWL